MQDPWKNQSIVEWCQFLLDSYAYWLKQELIDRKGTPQQQAERLFMQSFVVASHGTENDPILNYGNQTALNLWAVNWEEFTQTPSRHTAEPIEREKRAFMLEQVKTKGYISDYQGVRISKTGQRFWVDQATIWNIRKPDGTVIGQGATFNHWTYL